MSFTHHCTKSELYLSNLKRRLESRHNKSVGGRLRFEFRPGSSLHEVVVGAAVGARLKHSAEQLIKVTTQTHQLEPLSPRYNSYKGAHA